MRFSTTNILLTTTKVRIKGQTFDREVLEGKYLGGIVDLFLLIIVLTIDQTLSATGRMGRGEDRYTNGVAEKSYIVSVT